MTLAAPLWLFGLLLVPLMWWLHRTDLRLRDFRVARLELWQSIVADGIARLDRTPPDPVWKRRALLAALLVGALSGPEIFVESRRITIWIDDSLSMLVREGKGTRLTEGVAQLRAAVRELRDPDVDVRTLGSPWRSLGALTEETVATVIEGAAQQEPAAPPAALLRGDRSHWLLTDGADATLLHWPEGRHPDRVFQIAQVMRNVGLERLSARRNANDAQKIDVLLKVTNGGTAAEVRSVAFVTDAGVVTGPTLRLQRGESALAKATIPTAGKVRAVLQPSDELVADDEITLDLRSLRQRRVWVDPNCPALLRNAIRAHPALLPLQPATSDIDAAVDCASHPSARNVATIHVVADRIPTTLHGSLQWSVLVPQEDRVNLAADSLQVAARLKPGPLDTVLVAVDGEPLVVRRAGAPPILETALDFNAAQSAHRQDVPLLVDFMFESLLGGHLLDGVVMVDRGPMAVMVAPLVDVHVTTDASAPSQRIPSDVSRPLLVVAMLVLAWEVVALCRRFLRARRPLVVGSP